MSSVLSAPEGSRASSSSAASSSASSAAVVVVGGGGALVAGGRGGRLLPRRRRPAARVVAEEPHVPVDLGRLVHRLALRGGDEDEVAGLELLQVGEAPPERRVPGHDRAVAGLARRGRAGHVGGAPAGLLGADALDHDLLDVQAPGVEDGDGVAGVGRPARLLVEHEADLLVGRLADLGAVLPQQGALVALLQHRPDAVGDQPDGHHRDHQPRPHRHGDAAAGQRARRPGRRLGGRRQRTRRAGRRRRDRPRRHDLRRHDLVVGRGRDGGPRWCSRAATPQGRGPHGPAGRAHPAPDGADRPARPATGGADGARAVRPAVVTEAGSGRPEVRNAAIDVTSTTRSTDRGGPTALTAFVPSRAGESISASAAASAAFLRSAAVGSCASPSPGADRRPRRRPLPAGAGAGAALGPRRAQRPEGRRGLRRPRRVAGRPGWCRGASSAGVHRATGRRPPRRGSPSRSVASPSGRGTNPLGASADWPGPVM